MLTRPEPLSSGSVGKNQTRFFITSIRVFLFYRRTMSLLTSYSRSKGCVFLILHPDQWTKANLYKASKVEIRFTQTMLECPCVVRLRDSSIASSSVDRDMKWRSWRSARLSDSSQGALNGVTTIIAGNMILFLTS